MTKKQGPEKPKVVRFGGACKSRISAKEHRELERRIKQRQEGLRKVYREVLDKVVDLPLRSPKKTNPPRVHLTAEI